MLDNKTAEKLRYMKLYGMAEAFRSHSEDMAMQNLSFEERFGLLVDSEYVKRRSALLQRLITGASFKMPNACLGDIEYHADRKLDSEILARLSTCAYISEHRDVISQSAPGGWHSMIGEQRVADAMLDRIINNSYEILISGDSMRQKKSFKKTPA